MAMETPESRATSVWSYLSSSAAGLSQLLCQIHLLGGRLRVGRPLCFNHGRTVDARCRPAADALSRDFGKNDLARGMGAGRSQRDDSDGLARFLVAAGNLPDGDARPSDVCDRSALQ